MITYSTSSFSTPARSRAARITIEPSSVACLSAREPPSFPKGVRTAETITERAMVRAYQYAFGVPSARTTVKRHPERGAYDRAAIDAILDEALVCHVGFAIDGQPFVIPTIHARDGDVLYIQVDIVGMAEERLSLITAKLNQALSIRDAYWHAV